MFITNPQHPIHLYTTQFTSNLPHSTTFTFFNTQIKAYEPESEDPFVQGYFEAVRENKTIIVLNFDDAADAETVRQFFANLTGDAVEFVGKCYLGSDHDRALDFLRGMDLNVRYERDTDRIVVWFVAFEKDDTVEKLMQVNSAGKQEKKKKGKKNAAPTPASITSTKTTQNEIPNPIPSMDTYYDHQELKYYDTPDKLQQIQKELTAKLVEYDREEKKYLETIELIRNVPNKDGWVKVLPKIGNTIARPPMRAAEIPNKKKRKRDEVVEAFEKKTPMYSFQLREEKERSLKLLKKQFEEARKKINMLKSHNLFENSLNSKVEM